MLSKSSKSQDWFFTSIHSHSFDEVVCDDAARWSQLPWVRPLCSFYLFKAGLYCNKNFTPLRFLTFSALFELRQRRTIWAFRRCSLGRLWDGRVVLRSIRHLAALCGFSWQSANGSNLAQQYQLSTLPCISLSMHRCLYFWSLKSSFEIENLWTCWWSQRKYLIFLTSENTQYSLRFLNHTFALQGFAHQRHNCHNWHRAILATSS